MVLRKYLIPILGLALAAPLANASIQSLRDEATKCLSAQEESTFCSEVRWGVNLMMGTTEGFQSPLVSTLPAGVKTSSPLAYRVLFLQAALYAPKDVDAYFAKNGRASLSSAFKIDTDGLAALTSIDNLNNYLLQQVPYAVGGTIPAYQTTGTTCSAFTTGNGSILWTARHCLGDWQKFRQQKPENQANWLAAQALIIFDQKGNRVAGPLSTTDFGLTPVNMPAELPVNSDTIPQKGLPDDYVQFTASTPIAPPLAVGADPQPGEIVYPIGYPNLTGTAVKNPQSFNRARIGGLDVKEASEKVTQGQVVTLDALENVFPILGLSSGGFANLFGPAQAPYVKQMRFLSADCMEGMSGGPVLNSQGQVVGIISKYLVISNGDKDILPSFPYRSITGMERPSEL